MTLLYSLFGKLPNIATIGRDTNHTYFDESQGFKKSMISGRDFTSSLGLDIRVYNESGATARFSIDGVEFDVLDGTSRTVDNIYFDNFAITQTGATPNKITISVYGIKLETAKRIAKMQKINDGIWG